MDATAVARTISLQKFGVSDHLSNGMIKRLNSWNGNRDALIKRVHEVAAGREKTLESIEAIDPVEFMAVYRGYEAEEMRIAQDVLQTWREHPTMAAAVIDDMESQQEKAKDKLTATREKMAAKLEKAGLDTSGSLVASHLQHDSDHQAAVQLWDELGRMIDHCRKDILHKSNRGDFHNGNRSPIDDANICLNQIACKIAGIQKSTPRRKESTVIA